MVSTETSAEQTNTPILRQTPNPKAESLLCRFDRASAEQATQALQPRIKEYEISLIDYLKGVASARLRSSTRRALYATLLIYYPLRRYTAPKATITSSLPSRLLLFLSLPCSQTLGCRRRLWCQTRRKEQPRLCPQQEHCHRSSSKRSNRWSLIPWSLLCCSPTFQYHMLVEVVHPPDEVTANFSSDTMPPWPK